MLNKVSIMGRLVRDPELRRTQSGIAVTTMRIAVERDFKGPDGTKQSDFFDVVAWRNTAEFVSRYFSKGRMMVVDGRLQTREWTDRDNNRRTSIEIVADNIYFGDSRRDGPNGENYGAYGASGNSGSGYGSGDGSGIKQYNHEKVWYVDDVPTLIDRVRGDIARGRIIKDDMTTEPCWIARVDNCWAHGRTAHLAMADAQGKAMETMPKVERMAKFITEFPTLDTETTVGELHRWHGILTGSCRMGRDNFAESHCLKMEDAMTVRRFLEITEDSYGGDVIRELREMY